MGVYNCSMFCCTLLYVHSIAIILMGKREWIALLNLSSLCLLMVERLFLAVPQGCLQFVIVVFPDGTHLLFFTTNCSTLNESSIYFIFFIIFLLLLPADYSYSKLTFSKTSFRNTVKLSNSLDPDQVGADLGPNYLHSKIIDEDLHCLFDKAEFTKKLFYIK